MEILQQINILKFFKLDTQIKKTCTLILKSVYISRIFNLVLEVSKFSNESRKKEKKKKKGTKEWRQTII